jgi:GxxExxY protein
LLPNKINRKEPEVFAKARKGMTENQLSNIAIGCAIKVHSALGPGLLESAYEACLQYELVNLGLFVESQKKLPLIYETVKLECGYRLDLWVERKLIIDVKAVESLNNVYLAQVLTYLRLTDCKLGLLMNFNVLRLKDGLRRVVNNL